MEAAARNVKTVEITIDDEPYTAPDHKMAVRDIVALTGASVTDYYLKELKGKREQVSYKDEPDREITLHKGSTFVTVPLGGTEVS